MQRRSRAQTKDRRAGWLHWDEGTEASDSLEGRPRVPCHQSTEGEESLARGVAMVWRRPSLARFGLGPRWFGWVA